MRTRWPRLLRLPRLPRPLPYGRYTAYAAGAVLIAIGAAGLVADAGDTAPVGWALWVGGVTLAHDLLLVPLVLAVGAALTRLPAALRGPAQVTAVVAGSVVVVALPMVLGFGRRADDPSRLPLPYGTNLLGLLTIIVAAGCTAVVLGAYRGVMGRTVLTILGVLLAIWLVVSVIGLIFSTLKFLFFVGLVALVVTVMVTFIARTGRR